MESINGYLRDIENNIWKLKQEQERLRQHAEYVGASERRITELSRQNDLMKRMLPAKQLDKVLNHKSA